ECSDKNVYQYNSDNIEKINGIIKTIAEEQDCSYIDCASSVKGSDGYLPDNYSKDGTHLYKEFDLIWARYVAENM
ncbi:MAG: SGNH/GDSL hydrolase family protein, partial [Clostridia bacterium]|nr:SGNH/GDSL hydrolase family protein [Clostridia bacterium]